MQRKDSNMSQRGTELGTVREGKIIKLEEEVDERSLRVGIFYSKLKTNHKKRFDGITNALVKRYEITPRKSPVELLLIRQIALNTVRIENAEQSIIDGVSHEYSADVEKWLFLAQKERRDAIAALSTVMSREEKKAEKNAFDSLQDLLREEKGLKPSEKREKAPTSYERRKYDDISRVKKSE